MCSGGTDRFSTAMIIRTRPTHDFWDPKHSVYLKNLRPKARKRSYHTDAGDHLQKTTLLYNTSQSCSMPSPGVVFPVIHVKVKRLAILNFELGPTTKLGIVIMSTLSSLATPLVVMTIGGATNDDRVSIMTTLDVLVIPPHTHTHTHTHTQCAVCSTAPQ